MCSDVHSTQHSGHPAQLPRRHHHVLQAAGVWVPGRRRRLLSAGVYGLLASSCLLLGLLAPKPAARVAPAVLPDRTPHTPPPPPPPHAPAALVAARPAARQRPANTRHFSPARPEMRSNPAFSLTETFGTATGGENTCFLNKLSRFWRSRVFLLFFSLHFCPGRNHYEWRFCFALHHWLKATEIWMGRFYVCVLLSVALSATHTRNKMADRRDCFIIAGGRAALHPRMSWFCYIMNFSFLQCVWPQTEILLWLRINSTQCKAKQTTTILILMDKPGRLCNNPGRHWSVRRFFMFH